MKFFFFGVLQCKTGKKKLKKLNFINLFGYEEKKIMFLDFTRCKTEEK